MLFTFQMSDIGLTQDYEGSGYKFEIWWRRRNSGERYVLQAPNSDLKRSWVKDLTRLLWNQAVRNRGEHLFGYQEVHVKGFHLLLFSIKFRTRQHSTFRIWIMFLLIWHVHLINVLICVNSMYIYDTHASVATFYLLLL